MVRKQFNGILMSITSFQMSGKIGEYGKLGKNHYFEERLTKGDRGDGKKIRTFATQAKNSKLTVQFVLVHHSNAALTALTPSLIP